MQTFDISWVALFKIMLAGGFSYIVLPFLLVIRDLVLQKAIGKWILTEQLTTLISMCENDRWYLDNKFNKDVQVSYSSENRIYNIGNTEVSESEFMEYEKNREFHIKRYEFANSKISMKHNLITWLTRHYKQADGGNPIPNLRKKYYSIAESRNDKST